MNYRDPQLIHHGKRIDLLTIETDHPKGGTVRKEVVDHPGAVVILPFLEEKIVLIYNERPVIEGSLWELPAGTLEGEKPLECAHRELEEETGYRAFEMTHLLDFFTTPGFCNEKLFVYAARNLSFVGQKLDETEKIEVHTFSLEQALEMIRTQEIVDAKTITTLLFYHCFGAKFPH